MQLILNNEISYYVGNRDTILNMQQVKALEPFNEDVIDFFNSLSRNLIEKKRKYSDVTTFAFWCRRASLQAMKDKEGDLSNRLGRGIAFHSAPSNVPVNFAFSFAAGLLAGNANVVRLPAKDFEQVDIIVYAIKELLETKYQFLKEYVVFIRYKSNRETHDALSYLCDSRIIWGGDGTIARMRKSPLRTRAIEINFADRYSIAIIDSDVYARQDEQQCIKNASDFYNDTFFSDQNACTSPRIVIWTGESIKEAKTRFWAKLQEIVDGKYSYMAIQAVNKQVAFEKAICKTDCVKSVVNKNNALWRIELSKLDSEIMEYQFNSGFFFEYDASDLAEIMPILSNMCQTISYIGNKEAIALAVLENAPRGVDRIVPVGTTMDFSLTWDGFDLIRQLSRKIEII